MKIKESEHIKNILESCLSRFDDKYWKNSVKLAIAYTDKEIARVKAVNFKTYKSKLRKTAIKHGDKK